MNITLFTPKPAKTRIKITTKVNGTKEFTPQHKLLSSWYDFTDCDGYSSVRLCNPYTCATYRFYYTIEGAQEAIDKYLETFNVVVLKKDNDKVFKTEYVKYP
jgi:hypothetical protein